MTKRTIQGIIEPIDDLTACLIFSIYNESIRVPFKIECPENNNPRFPHKIVKNGHSSNTKAFKQQFYCKTCHRYFFISSSRFFRQSDKGIKSRLIRTFMDGHFDTKTIASMFNWSISSSNHIVDTILEQVAQKFPDSHFKMGKIRARVLFMDETFLKIGGKTWYLIMGILETGQIVAVELKEHRDQETLIHLVQLCESQLEEPLDLFVTDGFTTYKGVALALHHDLIHIRHIHKPPYGRIEIDKISYLRPPGKVKILTLTTTNEIFELGGCFLARVSERTVSVLKPPPKKRGRKAGGKNRPESKIIEEKLQKENKPKKRGRPPKKNDQSVHVFYYNKENGRILAWGESSMVAANVLNCVHHYFGEKCITTNLIEKEFSVIKILICFRGRRSIERWMRLVRAYCMIRNNPFILTEIITPIKISGMACLASISRQLTWSIEGEKTNMSSVRS